MKHLSFFLCIRYLCSKKIVLLSITSVMMSCALLITVASLFSGFIETFENSATEQMGDIIISPPLGVRITSFDKLTASLEENPHIEAATAILNSQGLLLTGKGNIQAVSIWGIELPARARVTPFGEFLIRQKESGEPPSFNLPDSPDQQGGLVSIAIITRPDEKTDEYDFQLARKAIGQKAMLTMGSSTKEKPKNLVFTISDIVFSGFYEIDRSFVYLPIEMLSKKLYPDQEVVADTIHIKIKPNADVDTAKSIIRGIWGDFAEKEFGWTPYATIITSRQLQARLVAEYKKQMGMLIVIFGVVSCGIILLISCIFYLIVMTKQKDIAVVKSCGLNSCGVMFLFVSLGTVIGIVGSGLGVIAGYIITKNVEPIEKAVSIICGLKLWKSSTYMFSKIPNEINWASVAWVAAAAIIAAAIGALIPAIAAARVKPVKILRYE